MPGFFLRADGIARGTVMTGHAKKGTARRYRVTSCLESTRGIPKGNRNGYAVTIGAKGLSYIGPLGWSTYHDVTAWVMDTL